MTLNQYYLKYVWGFLGGELHLNQDNTNGTHIVKIVAHTE